MDAGGAHYEVSANRFRSRNVFINPFTAILIDVGSIDLGIHHFIIIDKVVIDKVVIDKGL